MKVQLLVLGKEIQSRFSCLDFDFCLDHDITTRWWNAQKVWKCVGLPNWKFHQVHFYTHTHATAAARQWKKPKRPTILFLQGLEHFSEELNTLKRAHPAQRGSVCCRTRADGKYVFILTCRWSLWSVRTEARSWFQPSRTCEDKRAELHAGCSPTAVTARISGQLVSLSIWIIEQLICMEKERGEELEKLESCSSPHPCRVKPCGAASARNLRTVNLKQATDRNLLHHYS